MAKGEGPLDIHLLTDWSEPACFTLFVWIQIFKSSRERDRQRERERERERVREGGKGRDKDRGREREGREKERVVCW